jgi:hypothetical protein
MRVDIYLFAGLDMNPDRIIAQSFDDVNDMITGRNCEGNITPVADFDRWAAVYPERYRAQTTCEPPLSKNDDLAARR